MNIREILRRKGEQVLTIGPEATVRDLLALMAQYNVGAVVVSRDGTGIDGIVSERDVVRRLVDGIDVLGEPVSALARGTVLTCTPESTVDELARMMTEHRVRHIPVAVEGRLAGLVSIGDVVKSRIDELEFEREQLEHYIAGA